jgi:hypothetical protein
MGGKDARADQKILFLFCLFFFGQKKKEDFLWLAKRTLVSFDKQPVTLLLCFGVFEKKICETPLAFGVVVGVDGGIKESQVL